MLKPEAFSACEQSLGRFPEVLDHVPAGGVGFFVVAFRLPELAAERLAVAAELDHRLGVVTVFLERRFIVGDSLADLAADPILTLDDASVVDEPLTS